MSKEKVKFMKLPIYIGLKIEAHMVMKFFRLLSIFVSLVVLSSCSFVFQKIHYIPAQNICHIDFDTVSQNVDIVFYYADTTDNAYLAKLRNDYNFLALTDTCTDERSKILTILNWTHKKWSHSGSNQPSKSDPLTIIQEAEQGANFRCVEYGIVASGALNSIGIVSRVLGLKTSDVEKVKYGAGHVVSEVFSKQFDKWIFIDPQFNVMPFLGSLPLNAVEFQHAIVSRNPDLKLIDVNGIVSDERKESYINWIGKYLFYFDVGLDARVGVDLKRLKVLGSSKIMLVPIDQKDPQVFQRKYPMKSFIYSHSVKDFYQKPNH